jgi:glycosyltransferase involved in cell wall biosynthesis
VKYSVVIVSTRYARRLQAALLSIARQQDIALDQIEVIVAYVPGLDANEDVMDSVALAYPELHIVRAPFTAKDALSKGFLINESARLAQGEWVAIMDSDIVLPPNMFSIIEQRGGEAHFIAPDGRKMLDRETTAKILLGLVNPSEHWEALMDGPSEWRKREADGLPIGFFQCVRKSCFEKVQYEELHHFEGADWRFAKAIQEEFGAETWLEGVPVLHLDHGGSHWYGTQKQY